MIANINGIPVFNASIPDEESGMMKISLVDDPAVMSNFQAFDASKELLRYSIQDEEKRLVRGVVMRADFPIYRRSQQMGEYYIIYKAETIRQMAEKYLAENRQNLVNLMHEDGSDVEGVQCVQFFIKDSASGVSPAGFEDIADGSLFGEFHIVNDEVWEGVKDGSYKGFSLEGVFALEPSYEEESIRSIVDSLDGRFTRILSKNKMSKLKKIREAILKTLEGFASVTTDKGILTNDGEEIAIGSTVYLEDEEGNRIPAEDGNYTDGEGNVYVVLEGRLVGLVEPDFVPAEPAPAEPAPAEPAPAEPAPAPAEPAAEPEPAPAPAEPEPEPEPEPAPAAQEVATDNGTLSYTGELQEGVEVNIVTEEGVAPAPDGVYTTPNGVVITVADGKVSSITQATAVSAERQEILAKIEKFSASYDERKSAIFDSLRSVLGGFVDFYIIEAADDYVVIEYYDFSGSEIVNGLRRYDVEWDADGVASVSNPEEVQRAFVPLSRDENWKQKVEELEDENATLKAEVERLSRIPLAQPAHLEVTASVVPVKTGDKRLDRLAYRAALAAQAKSSK